MGKHMGGWSNIWATTTRLQPFSNEVNTENISEFTKEIENGFGKCIFGVDPFSICSDALKLLRFHRIVLLNLKLLNLTHERLGTFMDQAKAFMADDKGVVSQVHLLCSKSDPLLAWDLETLAAERGLVCDRQIRFPWAGLRGHNEAYIVIFTLSKTPTLEELAWKRSDLK